MHPNQLDKSLLKPIEEWLDRDPTSPSAAGKIEKLEFLRRWIDAAIAERKTEELRRLIQEGADSGAPRRVSREELLEKARLRRENQ